MSPPRHALPPATTGYLLHQAHSQPWVPAPISCAIPSRATTCVLTFRNSAAHRSAQAMLAHALKCMQLPAATTPLAAAPPASSTHSAAVVRGTLTVLAKQPSPAMHRFRSTTRAPVRCQSVLGRPSSSAPCARQLKRPEFLRRVTQAPASTSVPICGTRTTANAPAT